MVREQRHRFKSPFGETIEHVFRTDHRNGGPWVMWPDTPYAHIMVPIDSRRKK